jgi:4,5-dihydroxyphthalate decarboxylase
MDKLRLTLACWDYDRTRALQDGTVRVEGVDLTYLPLMVEETFWRMLRYQEFDAAELSMGSYLLARDKGSPRLVAIPVFPSRAFRHSYIFVHSGSKIQEPKDLIGKRVGVPEYQITMAVWARGILQHDYGVNPEDMHWFTGGAEHPGREEKLRPDLPKNIRIQPIGPDQTLSSMLDGGEIDALICAHIPTPFERRSPRVKRLFPNFREVERDYYRRTKIFPIMHTVALREDVYERHPWVAQSLVKAFSEAKKICQESMYKLSALRYMLPWSIAEMEEDRDLFGDDAWPYGLEANRHVLETLVGYAHEQGLIKKPLDVQSLFAPNTLGDFKI